MKRIYTDLLRVGFLLGVVGGLLLWADLANIVVVQALGVALFFAGGTHLTRRILFPQLDLQAIARDAIRDANIGAALVFLGIVLFLVAIAIIPAMMLK